MNNNLKTLTLAALTLLASCSKDETSIPLEDTGDQAIEELENTPIEANIVADNVLITGGTKNDGTPPAPNNAISLDISGSTNTALLGEGFDIDINSDGNVTGAYLVFKSNDGVSADSYYDINLAENGNENTIAVRHFNKKKNRSARKVDQTLDVDFNANVEPGTFCYEICVYDADGNISAPQEICVTVEAWGGNDEVVGKWNFENWFYDYDENNLYLPNMDNCSNSDGPYFCEEIMFELTRKSCLNQEYFELELKADGTYIEREKQNLSTEVLEVLSPNQVDLNAFEIICPGLPIFSTEEYTYESTGKWSYVDDEDKFVFIEFTYEEAYDGEVVYSETADPGDGFVYYGFGGYDGEVKLVGGKLIISSYEERTVSFEKE